MNLDSMEEFKRNRPLKLGFIGGGKNSAVGYTHFVSSQLDGKWQVVSGYFSKHIEVSAETAEDWNITDFKPYLSWKEYVDAEKHNVDAIVVLTPTPEHTEIVNYLLNNNVAVICEKALTSTLTDSNSIHETLIKTKGFLALTYNYSGYPMVRELRKRVQNHELGKVLQVQIEMQSDAFINGCAVGSPQAWRLKDGEIPTILLDLAVHVHHLCHFITGLSPVKVMADYQHFSRFEGIVDNAYLWVKYEQDVNASFWVSKTALGYKNGLKIRVFGENGSAEWYQEFPDKLTVANNDSVVMTFDRGNAHYKEEIRERFKPGHPSGFIEAFANLYSDIADNLIMYRQGTEQNRFNEYVFGWDHAHEGLNLFTKATESNATGVWINL